MRIAAVTETPELTAQAELPVHSATIKPEKTVISVISSRKFETAEKLNESDTSSLHTDEELENPTPIVKLQRQSTKGILKKSPSIISKSVKFAKKPTITAIGDLQRKPTSKVPSERSKDSNPA